MYLHLKISLNFELYLNILIASKLRQTIITTGISAYSVRVNPVICKDSLPNDCYCQFCSNDVDIKDEFHFMFKCECCVNLRRHYTKRY